MAKAEFYEISIRDKNGNIDKRIDIINELKNKLKEISENDLLCTKKTCMAILSEYIENNSNSITFDFSKLTDEVVNSTIISKPLDSIDTFKEFNKLQSEKAQPTLEEEDFILRLTSEYEGDDLINKLIGSEIDYFTIDKILNQNLNCIKKEEIDIFHRKTIQRMKKEKIFFNIHNLKNTYILIFQKAIHGFEIEHLGEYLNSHLFLNDNFRLSFKKFYDISFMDALQNSSIKNFKFSYSGESKNNLIDDNFATPFYFLSNLLGNNVTISVNNEDDFLDNQKLLKFFEMANNVGLLDNCKIKKSGQTKEIKSTDVGLELSYVNKQTINNIQKANEFFIEAIKEKEKILESKII